MVAAAYDAAQIYACANESVPKGDPTALVFLQGCALGNLPTWTGGNGTADFHYRATGAWLSRPRHYAT